MYNADITAQLLATQAIITFLSFYKGYILTILLVRQLPPANTVIWTYANQDLARWEGNNLSLLSLSHSRFANEQSKGWIHRNDHLPEFQREVCLFLAYFEIVVPFEWYFIT